MKNQDIAAFIKLLEVGSKDLLLSAEKIYRNRTLPQDEFLSFVLGKFFRLIQSSEAIIFHRYDALIVFISQLDNEEGSFSLELFNAKNSKKLIVKIEFQTSFDDGTSKLEFSLSLTGKRALFNDKSS